MAARWEPAPDEPSRPLDEPVRHSSPPPLQPAAASAAAGGSSSSSGLRGNPSILPDLTTRVVFVDGFPVRVDKGLSDEGVKSTIGSRVRGASLVLRDADTTTTTTTTTTPTTTSSTTAQATHADPAAGAADQARDARVRLVRLLRKHAPARVRDVDRLLEAHVGREEELLAGYVARFGPEPPAGPPPHLQRFERYCRHYGLPEANLREQLDDYAGKEEGLMRQLVQRHGPEPAGEEEGAAAQAADDPAVRARLVRFFEKWNPVKLPTVDDLMLEIRRGEAAPAVFARLEAKYGPEPGADEVIVPERTRGKSVMQGRERGLSRKASASGKAEGREGGWRIQLPTPLGGHEVVAVPKTSDTRARLLRFYTYYNPDKIEGADTVLAKFRGRDEELFRKLVEKYGPEPDDGSSMNADDSARGDYAACLDGGSGSPTKKSLQRLGSVTGARNNSLSPVSPARKSVTSPTASSPPRQKVRVVEDAARLKALLAANPSLPAWDSDYANWCGKAGYVMREDEAAKTVALAFPTGTGAWFPKEAVQPFSADEARPFIRHPSGTNLNGAPERAVSNSSFRASLTSDVAAQNYSFNVSRVDMKPLPPPPPGHGSPEGSAAAVAAAAVAEGAGSLPPAESSSGEEDEEDEEEEEGDAEAAAAAEAEAKAKAKEAKDYILPKEYVVTSLEYATEVSGTFIMAEGETANGYPVWERQRKEEQDVAAWLFSTPAGEWKVTDDKEDFETGDGYFNTAEHGGKAPHRSGRWLGEDDEEDKNIHCHEKRDEDGDRVIGGHLVVGRVADELTDEQLLYASFQRRKKFRVTKDVPISAKCSACKKFEAVCSKCYCNHRKVLRERREFLKEQYSTFELRRQVGLFYAAVAAGEDEDVKAMVSQGADVNWMAFFKKRSNEVNSLPEGGCHVSPLHVACAYHQPDIAMTLIGAGARYRRDPTSMLPLDYVTDAQCEHDVTMYLTELTTEYDTAMDVQEAWEVYHEEEYEEARDAFFELLMMYPHRDTCHLGLIYCHLALGDVEACLGAAKNALKDTDLAWVECQKETVQKAMESAMGIYHERCHAEESEGCIKRCGCVVYPPEWTLPLKALRRLDFTVIKHMLSFMPTVTSWNLWLALYPSPLLRNAVNMHVSTCSRTDRDDAVRIVTSVPAWIASFTETVVDHGFDTWNPKLGELAHVQVEAVECESVPMFPHFILKTTAVYRYHAPSAISKLKGWWGNNDKSAKGKRGPTGPAGLLRAPGGGKDEAEAANLGLLPNEVFVMQLEEPDQESGMDVGVCATHRGRVRIRRIAPGSAACRAGILPGYIMKYGEAEIVSYSDFEAAVEAHEAAGATSVTLTVAVDIADGSWVEAHGLTKAEHINGRRGIVEGINVKPNGGGSAVHVKFSEHGLIWMRPSNLIFLASEGSDGEDAASTAISSSRFGPQSLGGTVRSGASAISRTGSGVSSTSGLYPQPQPPRRSRNEAYERFRKEKLALKARKETFIFAAQLVMAEHTHPSQLYQSTWPRWRVELQDTTSFPE